MRKKKVKAMKSTHIITTLLLILFMFSCIKDNEYKECDYNKSIIGEWEKVSKSGWEKTNGMITDEFTDRVYDESFWVYTYKEDGTLLAEVYSRLEPSILQSEKYRWSIVGDTIVVKYADGKFRDAIEKILSINSTEMKTLINFSETNRNNVYEYYEVYTYKRR